MTTSTWKHIDIGSLCVHCGKDTAFGHSDMLFVDRIPADADLLDNDGVSQRLHSGFINRKDRIQALGNAVTPQQAAIPLGRIIDLIKS